MISENQRNQRDTKKCTAEKYLKDLMGLFKVPGSKFKFISTKFLRHQNIFQ